jgi:hypothetical protein
MDKKWGGESVSQSPLKYKAFSTLPGQNLPFELRLRDIGLMEFDRAKEAIAEGRVCVEQALPMLRRYM